MGCSCEEEGGDQRRWHPFFPASLTRGIAQRNQLFSSSIPSCEDTLPREGRGQGGCLTTATNSSSHEKIRHINKKSIQWTAMTNRSAAFDVEAQTR